MACSSAVCSGGQLIRAQTFQVAVFSGSAAASSAQVQNPRAPCTSASAGPGVEPDTTAVGPEARQGVPHRAVRDAAVVPQVVAGDQRRAATTGGGDAGDLVTLDEGVRIGDRLDLLHVGLGVTHGQGAIRRGGSTDGGDDDLLAVAAAQRGEGLQAAGQCVVEVLRAGELVPGGVAGDVGASENLAGDSRCHDGLVALGHDDVGGGCACGHWESFLGAGCGRGGAGGGLGGRKVGDGGCRCFGDHLSCRGLDNRLDCRGLDHWLGLGHRLDRLVRLGGGWLLGLGDRLGSLCGARLARQAGRSRPGWSGARGRRPADRPGWPVGRLRRRRRPSRMRR